jgi:DNA-binding CsgD family transcriptional regulator
MMLRNEVCPIDDVLRRREAPCLIVLDETYRIVGAEPTLQDFLASVGCVQSRPDRLPVEMEAAVTNVARRSPEGGLAFPAAGVILRTNVLSGPLGRSIAVTLERLRVRAPLDRAARRFHLTAREVEVLELLLKGQGRREIAAHLHIAQTTVAEHFKHLSTKIDARNRASMIAKVLDWPDERA